MPTKKKTAAKTRAGTKKDFGEMTVKQVMQKMVQSAHLKTKGDVIASLMIEGFGAVPVVDAKDKLLGIVSEHDLLAASIEGYLVLLRQVLGERFELRVGDLSLAKMRHDG
jgi:CBS-domain-containing membrane protein